MHALIAILFAAAMAKPSRPAVEGCKWELLSDKTLGLDAWVQRCDFKGRKTYFDVKGESLVMHYSDGSDVERAIDVIDIKPGEKADAAMTRFFRAHTPKKIADRWVDLRLVTRTVTGMLVGTHGRQHQNCRRPRKTPRRWPEISPLMAM